MPSCWLSSLLLHRRHCLPPTQPHRYHSLILHSLLDPDSLTFPPEPELGTLVYNVCSSPGGGGIRTEVCIRSYTVPRVPRLRFEHGKPLEYYTDQIDRGYNLDICMHTTGKAETVTVRTEQSSNTVRKLSERGHTRSHSHSIHHFPLCLCPIQPHRFHRPGTPYWSTWIL